MSSLVRRSCVSLLLLLCGCGAGSVQPGISSQLVAQTRESKGASISLRNAPIGSIAQSFTLPESGDVRAVQLKLFLEGLRPTAPSGYSVIVTVEASEQVSGQERPSGELAHSAAIAKIDLDQVSSGAGALYSFVFSEKFTLVKGTTYWIHLNADYPTASAPLFRLNWVGSNEASPTRIGTTLYEILNQPGTFFNGLGANQAMYFIVESP